MAVVTHPIEKNTLVKVWYLFGIYGSKTSVSCEIIGAVKSLERPHNNNYFIAYKVAPLMIYNFALELSAKDIESVKAIASVANHFVIPHYDILNTIMNEEELIVLQLKEELDRKTNLKFYVDYSVDPKIVILEGDYSVEERTSKLERIHEV